MSAAAIRHERETPAACPVFRAASVRPLMRLEGRLYRAATLHRIAAERGLTCEIPVKDVALMRKPADGPAA